MTPSFPNLGNVGILGEHVMRDGVAPVARRIGGDRRLEGVERRASGPLAAGVDMDVDASAVRVGDHALPFRLAERRGADRIGLVGIRLDEPGGVAFLRAVADDLEEARLDEIGVDALREVLRIESRVA